MQRKVVNLFSFFYTWFTEGVYLLLVIQIGLNFELRVRQMFVRVCEADNIIGKDHTGQINCIFLM